MRFMIHRSCLYLLGTLAGLTWFVCGGCETGPTLSPEDAVRHYVASQRLGDDQALAELMLAVQADPTCSVAHSAMGDIHRRHGDFELARRAYEAACQTNPYYFRPHYNLGVTYQSLAEAAKTPETYEGFLRKACEVFLRAVTIQASDYDANLNLSACYFQLGKYDQAEQYCQAAIRMDESKPAGFTNLAIIHDCQNRLYDAVKAYKQSLELNPQQPKLLLNLGSTLMRQGRFEDALTAFKTSAKLDPTSSAPWEQLGSCHYRMGTVEVVKEKPDPARKARCMDEAMKAYQKALTINPRSSDSFRGMGVVYMTQYMDAPAKTELRDKALSAWNSSLDLNANQEDLKKLVEKYTPKPTTAPL